MFLGVFQQFRDFSLFLEYFFAPKPPLDEDDGLFELSFLLVLQNFKDISLGFLLELRSFFPFQSFGLLSMLFLMVLLKLCLFESPEPPLKELNGPKKDSVLLRS